MAPRRNVEKKALVILLDVGKNMNEIYEGKPVFSHAVECVQLLVKKKMCECNANRSNDETALILFASERTENELANENDGQYEHVEVTCSLRKPTMKFLRDVCNMNETTRITGDWIDALIVALDFIKKECDSIKCYSEVRLVAFSNFIHHISYDREVIQSISNGISNLNVNVFIVRPSSSVGFKGCKILEKMISECGGVIYTLEEAKLHLTRFKRKSVKPTPWNATFAISNRVKIAISAYKKVAESASLSWRLESVDDPNAPVEKCSNYVKFNNPDTQEASESMQSDVTSQEDEEDDDNIEDENGVNISKRRTEVEVARDDVMEAYQYGSTIIPLSEIDKEAMLYKSGPKGLYLIGCTKRERVPYHTFIGEGCYVVTSRNGDDVAKKALAYFVTALYDADLVGIAKKIYRQDCASIVGALFPMKNEDDKCGYLLFVQLPFAEDERVFKFPNLGSVKTTSEQDKAMDKLIDDLDLDALREDEEEEDVYDPELTYDPGERRQLNILFHRGAHPKEPIGEDVSVDVANFMKPLPEMAKKLLELEPVLKAAFPLQPVEKPSSNKGETKQVKSDVSDKDLARVPFETELRVRKNRVIRWLESVQTSECLECLRETRSACVNRGSSSLYNEWLTELKKLAEEKNYVTFWESVKEEHLGLILKTEANDSDVDAKVGKEFLKNTNGCGRDDDIDIKPPGEDDLDEKNPSTFSHLFSEDEDD